MTYVFDACALIALLKGEEGKDKINALFQQAYTGEITLAMSTVNLLEVYYGFIRDEGLDEAARLLAPVYNTPLTII
jgi:PIN domain nuclease of toxin-antitoxin system